MKIGLNVNKKEKPSGLQFETKILNTWTKYQNLNFQQFSVFLRHTLTINNPTIQFVKNQENLKSKT